MLGVQGGFCAEVKRSETSASDLKMNVFLGGAHFMATTTRTCATWDGDLVQLFTDVLIGTLVSFNVSSLFCRFSLSGDMRSCVDVDECQGASGPCDQKCNNTVGSYECSCAPGFTLEKDRHRCKSIEEALLLLPATRTSAWSA